MRIEVPKATKIQASKAPSIEALKAPRVWGAARYFGAHLRYSDVLVLKFA